MSEVPLWWINQDQDSSLVRRGRYKNCYRRHFPRLVLFGHRLCLETHLFFSFGCSRSVSYSIIHKRRLTFLKFYQWLPYWLGLISLSCFYRKLWVVARNIGLFSWRWPFVAQCHLSLRLQQVSRGRFSFPYQGVDHAEVELVGGVHVPSYRSGTVMSLVAITESWECVGSPRWSYLDSNS